MWALGAPNETMGELVTNGRTNGRTAVNLKDQPSKVGRSNNMNTAIQFNNQKTFNML